MASTTPARDARPPRSLRRAAYGPLGALLRVPLLALLALMAVVPAEAQDLLEPEKAFPFTARTRPDGSIEARFDVAKGYYLYRDKLRFRLEGTAATLGVPRLPQGEVKDDEFFGRVEIYRGELVVGLPVEGAAAGAATLAAESQGCADIGVCYPPMVQRVNLTLGGASATGPPSLDESAQAQWLLSNEHPWLAVATFFGFGLLLAFTPCVLPMLPILSGIVVGRGERITRRQGLALSATFVFGMALTYAAVGVAAAKTGTMLASALQTPWVLGTFAVAFVALALAMFGLYELQLPGFLRQPLAQASRRFRGGHLLGVFGMGAVSALVVSPCVAAPLAGALLYIAQSGNVALGGTALFAMAVGMGVPLLLIGASAGALLPKAGAWMESVKRFFGWMLLALAIWILGPVLPLAAVMLLWGMWLCAAAVYLHVLDPLPGDASGWRRLGKAIGIVLLLAGAAELFGALSGAEDPLQPLRGLRAGAAPAASGADTGLPGASSAIASPAGPGRIAPGAPRFERIRSLEELDARLRAAGGRPVILDFYADWCVSCKEMERFTFSDPSVAAKMREFVLLQADVTANDEADRALLKRFSLFGPPGIIFFDRQGHELPGVRVIGYQPAGKFLALLDALPV